MLFYIIPHCAHSSFRFLQTALLVANPEVNRSLLRTSSGSPQTKVSWPYSFRSSWINTESVGIRLEEQENHHAGDGNIEPNGERQACDSAVHREPARQREKERRQYHRQSDHRKDYVAG